MGAPHKAGQVTAQFFVVSTKSFALNLREDPPVVKAIPRSRNFNNLAFEQPYEMAAEFPILPEGCEEWFVEYLKELGFSNSGRPIKKEVMKLWVEHEQGFRTEDKRLIIRSSDMDPAVGVTVPNFVNLTNNFQLYWNYYAMKDASSNINVLSYDHFFELVTYPSRDYHDPLKVQEIFAPTSFDYGG